MYLVTLAHEPDKVGVIISPLIGLMDEQVYYCMCTECNSLFYLLQGGKVI